MSRFRTPALVVSGALTVALLGAALAVITDTFSFKDNQVTTPDLDPADLQMSIVENDTAACSEISESRWADGPALDGLSEVLSAALVTGDVAIGRKFRLCMRNVGDFRARMKLSTNVQKSSELAACGLIEIDAGDTTCAVNDPGELEAVVSLDIFPVGQGIPDQCFFSNTLFSQLNRTVDLGQLDEGETCMFDFAWRIGGTPEVRYQAMSDQLDVSVTFGLETIS
jgi:hypothetical protein